MLTLIATCLLAAGATFTPLSERIKLRRILATYQESTTHRKLRVPTFACSLNSVPGATPVCWDITVPGQ